MLRVPGDRLEIAFQTVPALGAALGIVPVGNAHRPDVPAGRACSE